MHQPVLPPRRTLPSVRCTDQAFVYRNADATDLHATFERARLSLGLQQRQLEAHTKATRTQAKTPPRRVRAGTPITLPLF